MDAVGNTPLLRLRRICPQEPAVFGKAEFLNPSGSVKDRAAKAMLLSAFREGRLTAGMEILDATSGSTGISYCMMGAMLGCSVTLCMPANASKMRKQIMMAYGGKIIETSPLEGPEGALEMARQLVKEHPGRYFYPDQYNNEWNWRAHYATTAEEIWEQTEGRITHFVAGTGTSGTFVGTVRRLKEKNPAVRGVMVQPDSPFHGLEGLRHIASAQYKGFFDAGLVDEEVPVRTEDAYEMVHCLAREEGLLVGISAAANVLAALEVQKSAPEGSVIVTVLCDNGLRYLEEPVWKNRRELE